MEMVRNRATDLFPSVLLTVLSMIQALALELLWTRLRESPYLWTAGWDAVLGWTQVAAMLLGFLVVWLFYVSIVMRFRWLPSLQDSVVPFAIGILEFTLVDLMGPDSLPLWFYGMALIFAVSTWASHTIYRRARRDPANREFFDSVQLATMRDFAPAIAAIAGIALLGLALHTLRRSALAGSRLAPHHHCCTRQPDRDDPSVLAAFDLRHGFVRSRGLTRAPKLPLSRAGSPVRGGRGKLDSGRRYSRNEGRLSRVWPAYSDRSSLHSIAPFLSQGAVPCGFGWRGVRPSPGSRPLYSLRPFLQFTDLPSHLLAQATGAVSGSAAAGGSVLRIPPDRPRDGDLSHHGARPGRASRPPLPALP